MFYRNLTNFGGLNTIDTSILITLLFFEAIVNRRAPLSASIITLRLNPGDPFSDTDIQKSMQNLANYSYIISNKNKSNLSLRFGVVHEYKKPRPSDPLGLYRIRIEKPKIKLKKLKRIILPKVPSKFQLMTPLERTAYKAGSTRGCMDTPLKKCHFKERDENYQKFYMEGYKDAQEKGTKDAKKERREAFLGYQLDYTENQREGRTTLKKRKKNTVQMLDLTEDNENRFSANNLKIVRFSASQNKDVTQCFIPLMCSDPYFAIKYIVQYHRGNRDAKEFISQAKEAIRNENDEKLNLLMDTFNVRIHFSDEVPPLQVNAYHYDKDKGLIPREVILSELNSHYQMSLVEIDGMWHYLSQV